ncbi:MAG: TerB N-terminal domain-containing protein [Alphaproteobacteria bacterium]|nr:TerB N-terminal domain-containing protein [Alphaproteobacteria bacterium]
MEINGLVIPGGMLYVGDTDRVWDAPKCLVQPSLPVARSDPDRLGQFIGYWPNYASIDPRSRLAYLQWLAGGRCDPHINIGYVFLYFYGLERRLALDEAMGEADAITAEVRRLRDIYAGNRSFDGYSADFLQAIDLLTDPGVCDRPPPPTADPSYGLPSRLLLGLGRLVAEGKPLDADWALAWMLAHPETRLRTPARRAFDEFCALFRIRFSAKYPNGLKVNPPKGTIGALPYRVASNDFQASIRGDFSDWPNVANMTKPVNQAREVAEACMTELEPYSRFLGRSPEDGDSLQAQLLLPSELLVEASGAVAGVREWLLNLREPTAIETLLARLGIASDGDKPGRGHVRAAAEALDGLGYGLEPDVRLGGRVPKPGEKVVVFPLPPGVRSQPDLGSAYQAAALTLGLCAVLVHADSVVTPEEERHLLKLVEDSLHLTDGERARLEAHARWLIAEAPSLSQFQSRLAGLTEGRRHDLARFVVAVAAADGHVAVTEVRLLERVYKLLGLEAGRLFSDLHAFGASDDEPVVVRPAIPVPEGKPIPLPPKPEAGVVLDIARIERIRSDTAKVSSLLSEIFVDETMPAVPEPEPRDEPSPFDGLDRRHEALLQELASRTEWPRTDFEQLCRSIDLLPGGALEGLNEWAFERFDDAIVEDGDPVVVNQSLLQPLAGPTP